MREWFGWLAQSYSDNVFKKVKIAKIYKYLTIVKLNEPLTRLNIKILICRFIKKEDYEKNQEMHILQTG